MRRKAKRTRRSSVKLEDAKDLEKLQSMRKRPLKLRKLDEFFLAIVERSRARLKKEGGIPASEMRRRLKLRP
jgi:hypothetical protein